MTAAKRMRDWYHKGVEIFISLVFAGMLISMTIGILGRYLPFFPRFEGYMELTLMLMVWLVFLGSSLGIQRKAHIGVDILVNSLKPSIRKYVMVTINLIIIIWLIMLFRGGISAVTTGMLFRYPVSNIPKGFVYLAFPVGSAMMIFEVMLTSIDFFTTSQE